MRMAMALLLIVWCATTAGSAVAQNMNSSNLTSSAYNRYGYGRMGSMGNTVTKTMGDVGIALRSNQYTTLMNPASLTAIDTLTMIFTVGLDAEMGRMTEGAKSHSQWDAGFSGMSMQAPLWRNFAMSLSLNPYSMVGYYYGASDKQHIQSPTTQGGDTLSYASTHQGVGGINNFMLGLGWRPLHSKRQELNLGVNAGWLFGQIQHTSILSTSAQANATYVVYEAAVRALYLQMGMQYTYRMDAKNSLTLGAIYAPALNMNVGTETVKYSTDTLLHHDKWRSGIKQPMRYGAGLTYNRGRQLTLTAEMEVDKWSDVVGINTEMNREEGVYNDMTRLAVGVEYLPKLVTNNLLKACRYRAGLSYKTSYMKVGGQELHEMGATLGMSIPVNKRSAIDLGVGYQTLRPADGGMVKENYLTLNVGLTFNEMMFFRNMLR